MRDETGEASGGLGGRFSRARRLDVAFFWVPAILQAAVIFALSSDPRPEDALPAGSVLEQFYDSTPGADKITHFASFFVLALLVSLGLNRTWPPASSLRLRDNALLASLVSMAYAAGDEVHQHFVPPRTPDVADFLADCAGAAAGAALAAYLILRSRRAKRAPPPRP